MSKNTSSRRFLIWIGLGVVLVYVLLVLLFVFNAANKTPLTTTADPSVVELVDSQRWSSEVKDVLGGDLLEFVDADWGDVWDRCAIDQYIHPTEDLEAARSFVQDLILTSECLEALDPHVRYSNPFTRYGSASRGFYEFSLIHLENPMVYERVFSDPTGDLEKVLDALWSPECLWEHSSDDDSAGKFSDLLPSPFDIGNVSNSTRSAFIKETTRAKWELKDTCHAESFANYAAFFDACYRESAFGYFLKLQSHFAGHLLTRKQTSSIWKNYLGQRWVETQCQQFEPSVELSLVQYPYKYPQVLQIGLLRSNFRSSNQFNPYDLRDEDTLYNALLSFGAQFGDEAASFSYDAIFYRINQPWRFFVDGLRESKTLNMERLQTAIDLVSALDRAELDYDLEWLVDHTCNVDRPLNEDSEAQKEQLSCKSLINELHINLDTLAHTKLQTLTKIERVAIELDVYE